MGNGTESPDWDVSEGDQEVWFKPCKGGRGLCWDAALSDELGCFVRGFFDFLVRQLFLVFASVTGAPVPALDP